MEDYSIKTLSDDLYNFTQKLNVGKFTLVGHSMGGMTAMMFALDHPQQISKLVLVSTSAKTATSIRMMLWVLIHVLPYSICINKCKSNYCVLSGNTLISSI